MKFSLLVLAALVAYASASTIFNAQLDGHWELFKVKHGKTYSSDEEEGVRRLKWERNVKLIEKHNREADAGKHTYRLGMNKYGDMVKKQFLNFI